MVMEYCDGCRHQAGDGCRKDFCGAVRLWRMAQRIVPPATPCTVSAREPLGPGGTIGYEIDAAGVHVEFAPTDQGYIAARGLQGQLELAGLTPAFTVLHKQAG